MIAVLEAPHPLDDWLESLSDKEREQYWNEEYEAFLASQQRGVFLHACLQHSK